MPSNRTHKKVCELILGKCFPEVDATLDAPVAFLGSSHRKVLHTVAEAAVVGLLVSGDARGAAAGVIHVATDFLDSFAKKKVNKIISNRGENDVGKKQKA